VGGFGADPASRRRWEVLAPSDEPWPYENGESPPVRETTQDDTEALIGNFEAGADLIDVSSGGISSDPQIPHTGAGSQVPYAERVRAESDSDVAVGAVGGISSSVQADGMIRNGRADLTILAREHLRDPCFSLHAARELDDPDRRRTAYPVPARLPKPRQRESSAVLRGPRTRGFVGTRMHARGAESHDLDLGRG
jgi:2,4-dienoyl-CoA reductase-like NADH-dependent reductase (Old Yellow Enzyme family)